MIEQMIDDPMIAVVTDRKPISALAEARREWKRQGGSHMRDEYEKAMAKNS